MSDTTSMSNPDQIILASVTLLPVEEEEEDVDTLSAVLDVQSAIWNNISSIQEYELRMESNHARDVGLILMLGEIVREIVPYQDFFITFLKAGTAIINVLAKQGRVKKIEVRLDGDSITIEDANQLTVQRLIDIFETKHPQKITTVTAASKLLVTGYVSKKGRIPKK